MDFRYSRRQLQSAEGYLNGSKIGLKPEFDYYQWTYELVTTNSERWPSWPKALACKRSNLTFTRMNKEFIDPLFLRFFPYIA